MDTQIPMLSNMFIKIFLMVTLLTHHYQCISNLCNRDDKRTLLRLKKDFKNPHVFDTWNPKTDCCHDWLYVGCDMKTGRIDALRTEVFHDERGYLDLTGPIPDVIGDLPFLETIWWYRCPNLTGPLPQSLTRLRRLRVLVIHWSSLSGPVPGFLSQIKGLVDIDLRNNKLTGLIPHSLSSLPKLTSLYLDNNKLTGQIPRSFGDFRGKKFILDLSNNQLSGRIPESLGKKDFHVIRLSSNKLRGDASKLFGANKNTEAVELSKNMLEFDLSKVEFPRKLNTLHLDHNKIYGSIPEGLARLKHLHKLSVSHNRLCGKIPAGRSLQEFGEKSYSHNLCLCGPPLKNKCRKLL